MSSKLTFFGISFLIFALAIASPFYARAKTLTNLRECIDTQSTNTAWATCNWKEVRMQEASLKKTWHELDSKYWNREAGYQALLADQKQWEAFKEAACKAYDIDFGREGQVLDYPECKAEIISQRIDYLKKLIKAISPDGQ